MRFNGFLLPSKAISSSHAQALAFRFLLVSRYILKFIVEFEHHILLQPAVDPGIPFTRFR